MVVIHIVHSFFHSVKREKAFEIKAFFKTEDGMRKSNFQFSGEIRLTEHRKYYVIYT